MRIGQDFDKIEFEFFGLELLEPNSFIWDTLIFIVAFYIAYRIKKLNNSIPFFQNWRSFFIVFGLSFFVGGFGHLLYNYWGVAGKASPWYLGIFASFFIEKAMISIYPKEGVRLLFKRLIYIKLIFSLLALTYVISTIDLIENPTFGMVIPTLNSLVGLLFSLGYLGVYYSQQITPTFRYLWISVLIMIPSVFFLALKINIHQWFDRNDFSHLLLIVGMIFYFAGIKGYDKYIKAKFSE